VVAHEDGAESEITSETADLKADISELRSKMNAQPTGGYEGGCGCGAPAIEAGCGGGHLCGGCGCEPCGAIDCYTCDLCCCRSSGFIGGAELAWLKPHNSSSTGFDTRLECRGRILHLWQLRRL
jgi:hypothetical protein